MLDEASVAALVKAAHARERIAVAHIGTESHARGAIAAGVDGLAHLFEGTTVTPDFGQFAAKHGVFVIPTLSVLYSACGRPDGPSLLEDADVMKHVKPQFRSLLEMSSPPSKLSCDALPPAINPEVRKHIDSSSQSANPPPDEKRNRIRYEREAGQHRRHLRRVIGMPEYAPPRLRKTKCFDGADIAVVNHSPRLDADRHAHGKDDENYS